MLIRCQCPDEASNIFGTGHNKGNCRNPADYKVMRKDKIIYLCGDCVRTGDLEKSRVIQEED